MNSRTAGRMRGLLFILPSLLGVGVFVLAPFLEVVRRSFTGAMNGAFVGLKNYADVFSNGAFRLAAGFGPAHAQVQAQGLGHLFAHAQHGIERGHGLLKDHAHAAAPDAAQLLFRQAAVRHSGAGSGLQQPAGLVHSGLFRVEMFKILHFFKTPVPLNSCYTGAPRQLAGLTVIFTMLRLTAAVSMSSR